MVPCAGTTGAQESRHVSLVVAGPSCSLRLLTPHSRCGQFSHPGEQPGDIMRCHEMHFGNSDIPATGEYQIAPLSPAPSPGPLPVPRPPSALGRHITLWPSAHGSTFDASWLHPEPPLMLLSLFGPAHHAIPGRTSHHGSIALARPCKIVTATPARRPCVGSLFVCYAISLWI